MGGINLTTLANVRAWVGSSTDTDNPLLARLISEASRATLNYLQRADIGLTNITEEISGRGQRRLQLRNWPVISVSSLSVGGIIVPQSLAPTNYGFFLEPVYGSTAGRPQNLGIRGGACVGGIAIGSFPDGGVTAMRQSYTGAGAAFFPHGIGNISVGYSYGYCVQAEAHQVPNDTTYQVQPNIPYGGWSEDLGVTYANGMPMVAVGASPTVGQYIPPQLNTVSSYGGLMSVASSSGDNPTTFYQFSAADAGANVLLSYNYVPYDIEQAVIEIVGERYRYKSRIGLASTSLGGQETASYMVRDQLTASQMMRLNPYRIVWTGA